MKIIITWLDRIMTAVTFAEANVPDVGLTLITGTEHKAGARSKRNECGTVLAGDLQSANIHS